MACERSATSSEVKPYGDSSSFCGSDRPDSVDDEVCRETPAPDIHAVRPAARHAAAMLRYRPQPEDPP
jgi:hypothetical protein